MVNQSVERTSPGVVGFHPGRPEITTFPFVRWSKLLTAQMRNGRNEDFGYHVVKGHPGLRSAIANYLAVSRGVKCTPEQVVVVTGTQAALDLIARVFMDPGDHFQIEEPGYLGAFNAFINAGGRPLPLTVGSDGWSLRATRRKPRIIFVTPSCQWPRSLVMPLDARLELLRMAKEQDAWIVEDDYDSEYRFRGRPVPAMQGLDTTGRVIYMGTMSKTMFPSLRVAYIVAPRELADGLAKALHTTGQYPPLFLQAALAEFISRGFFAAHLRRMRRLYAKRRREFIAACESRLRRWLTISEADTGMQVIARLAEPFDDGEVFAAAVERGVDFLRLSTQFRQSPPEQGLIFGYAGVSEDRARAGIERLRLALQAVEQQSGKSKVR